MTSRPKLPTSIVRLATIEAFAHDVRHALRLLRRDPTFTFAALATLALGIGLNTAIFSVAYGVLWRPLPYHAPDRLIMISSAQQTETGIKTFGTWAPMSYEGLRTRVTTLDSLAAYNSSNAELTGRGEPLGVPALAVSPNFFDTLGVTPARGRAFLTGVAARDDDGSAIVSDRLWRSSSVDAASGRNARPCAGLTPSVAKKFGLTSSAGTCSGSPRPVSGTSMGA